jgi:tetratricopeptide (TPR) repeat protein
LNRVIEAVDKHMGAEASAIYLRYDLYRPEASSFDVPIETVDFSDPLIDCLRSTSAPTNPRTIGSSALGDLAFPMMAAGGLVGFLTVVPRRIDYEPEDLAVLSALAEATGIAVLAHDPLGTLPSDLSIVDSQELYAVPGFSGRAEELALIAGALAGENTVAAVVGMGGVGKSSVAREYAWRHRDRYSVVWWLNAQTEDGIVEGLQRLGSMFVRGLDQLADRRAAAQRVINSVLSGFDKPMLLIFDNVEDERVIRTWMPRSGTRALVTSRNVAWSAGVTPIPLNVWDTKIAVEYLQRESGRSDLGDAEALAIVESLGALPLALAHVAATLRTVRVITPRRYLENITAHLKKSPKGADYPRSVYATFGAAIAQAEQQAPGAAAVLCFATLFAPDGIPDELFHQPIDIVPEGLQPVVFGDETVDLRSTLADDLRLDEALGALDRLSLLAFAQQSRTYSVHRLVQLAGRDLIGATTRTWHECAIQVVDSVFPNVEFATWPQCERLLAHARAALDALPNDSELIAAANLASRCSSYMRERAEYIAAERLLLRALAIHEKVLGPNHLDVANTLNRLTRVYWGEGRYAEAESVCTRALAIRENASGAEDLDVAESLNNLAVLSLEQGRYEEAETRYQRALAIREKTLGPDDPVIAYSLNNLANAYAVQGRYAEAEPLHFRALAIREKAHGDDHPDVGYSLSNLGNLNADQGRHAEAEKFHTRALAIWEKTLGPDHPQVSHALGSLASSYANQGRYAEAEALHLRALAISEKTLGPEHPNVAQNLNDLALMYHEQGRIQEAKPLLTRALSVREKALGCDHPLTKYTRESLDTLSTTR